MRYETDLKTGERKELPDAPPSIEPPLTAEQIDAIKTALSDVEQFGDSIKAFALVLLDEINLLRTQAGLQPRTLQQLKNAIKAKL